MNMDIDLKLEIKLLHREVRLFPLHEFRLGCKAKEAMSNICGTMGKDILFISTAQPWFYRFKNGNFELDDLLPERRRLQVDMGLLNQCIEEDPRLTTRCFSRTTWIRSLTLQWKHICTN